MSNLKLSKQAKDIVPALLMSIHVGNY